MSSLHPRPNGHHWIFYRHDGKRHTWRLGVCSREDAEDAQRRLDRLIGFRKLGVHPDPETAGWLFRLSERLHSSLVTSGLAEGRGPTTLGELIERHRERLISRGVKPSTLVNSRVLYNNLLTHFLPSRLLRSITLDDGDQFRRMLLERGGKNGGPLAKATVVNRCRRARGIFKFAVDRNWLAQNPFREIAGGSEVNAKRDRYITVELFTKIVDATVEPELRLLLALVRFCGLRCPSEIQPLTWAAVDWKGGVLVVQSPKTEAHEGQERREVPLFEPVQPYLLAAAEARPDREPLMFPRHQNTRTAITDRLAVLCRKVGEPLWPKPMVNMRASAETDAFTAGHPINQVAAWFGHTPEIALKHYSRVVKEREARAAAALRVVKPTPNPKPNPKQPSRPAAIGRGTAWRKTSDRDAVPPREMS